MSLLSRRDSANDIYTGESLIQRVDHYDRGPTIAFAAKNGAISLSSFRVVIEARDLLEMLTKCKEFSGLVPNKSQ
jgi:hypothetical protein